MLALAINLAWSGDAIALTLHDRQLQLREELLHAKSPIWAYFQAGL
jgi:hypothetical protein